ncbi:hypothetical protein BJ170DRAFT_387495 [Xylariales sp. AK1849]|nr:hypothetical protein BJ170DRAFT_387495 [Xylariales sp. AK1849]
MSQRGPASRPASPFPTRSPTSDQQNSPARLQSGLRGGGNPSSEDGSQESSGTPSTNGERPQLAQRSLGVHHFLNPADNRSTLTSVGPPIAQRRTEHKSPNPNPINHYGSSPSAQQPLMFQGRTASPQQQGISRLSGEGPVHGGPSAERGSPSAVHPWPAFGAARHYLTPRSPRVGSLSHISNSRPTNTQQPRFPPTVTSGPKGPFAGDHGSDISPQTGHSQPQAPPFSGLGFPGASPPGSIPALAAPIRSLSQPILGQPGSTAQEQHAPHSSVPGHSQRPHIFPTPSPYATAIPPTNRGFIPLPTGDPRWPGGLGSIPQQGPGEARSVPVSEGPSNLMFAQPGEDPIPVAIDMHNASRQADEKRLRNAGASARFRQRKKDRDQQRDTSISKLEAHNRELENRIRDLESERERYRTDRDRLRDIVCRTPGIAELAYRGPQSPSARSVGSFAERSPHGSVPPPPPIPAVAYGGADLVTGERPSRRRRTDPQVDFGTPSYVSPLPLPLSHNAPLSQPGTPSAVGRTERLPSLRLDPAIGGSSTISEPGSANTPAQSFSPYRREPYESGWATQHGGPADPGQR